MNKCNVSDGSHSTVDYSESTELQYKLNVECSSDHLVLEEFDGKLILIAISDFAKADFVVLAISSKI